MTASDTLTAENTAMPIFDTMLRNLQHFLTKAVAQAGVRGEDPELLLQTRLAPDMLSLAGQVRYACISAKAGAARLAGVEVPAYDPVDDLTLAQAQGRLSQTREWLAALPRAGMAGAEAREFKVKVGSDGRMHAFTGAEFTKHWVLSHFFFHVTMAYALLRHNGIDLGKVDFIWGPAQTA